MVKEINRIMGKFIVFSRKKSFIFSSSELESYVGSRYVGGLEIQKENFLLLPEYGHEGSMDSEKRIGYCTLLYLENSN